MPADTAILPDESMRIRQAVVQARAVIHGYTNNRRWLTRLADGRTAFVKHADDQTTMDRLRDEHGDDGPHREAGRRFRFLIRDHDGTFSQAFDSVITAAGVQILSTPIQAPRADAVAERFVGSLRRELPDWILIINQRHAASVLVEYQRPFNEHRPPPRPRPHRCGRCPTHAQATRSDLPPRPLGGLLREYTEAA